MTFEPVFRRRLVPTAPLYLAAVLAALPLLSASAYAQGGGGSITGSVLDATGAAVPNATIIAKNIATGVSIERKSTGAGVYNLQDLSVGDYTVMVTATGFGTRTTGVVHVNALQVVTINLRLNVSADMTVNVSAAGLNQQNPTLGDSVSSQDYQLLPLVMNAGPRDPTAFISLANGVDPNRGYGGGAVGYNNETYIDGVVATTINTQGAASNASSGAIVEAVEQSEVQTAGISARYQGQGFSNFTMKSGTNKWHGTAFEFFRNTALDTWNYLSKQTANALGQIVKPNEKQNEYGGTFSGPILKNKAFFFAAVERMNYRSSPNPGYFTLPTLAMRNGDFTGYAAATVTATTPNGYHIYDPDTTSCNISGSSCSRTQFSYNGVKDVIDPSRLSAVSKKLQAQLPTNLSNGKYLNNYLTSQPFGYNFFKASMKGDYVLTPKHRLSAEYLTGQRAPINFDSGSVLPLPYAATTRTVTYTNTAVLGLNSVLSAHLVNDLKYSFLRYETVGTDPATGPGLGGANFGLSPLPAGWASDSFPVVVFTGNYAPQGFDSSGSTNSTNRPSNTMANTFGVSDDLAWTLGRHSLSIGGNFMWYQYNSNLPTGGSSDSFAFDTSTTSQFAPGTASVAPTDGSTYAGYLLGDLTTFYLSSNKTFTSIGGRFKALSPYFQDDWKVNDALTLNLGLRWDIYTPYHEVLDRMSFFNPDLPNPIAQGAHGSIQYAGNFNQYTCHCDTRYTTYLGNIQPRVGFAFKADPATVLHGYFGIMTTHSGGEGGRGGAREGTNQFGLSSSSNVGQILGYEPVQQWDHALPTLANPPLDNTYGIGDTTTAGFTGTPQAVFYDEPYLARRPGYYENYGFGIERQLFPKTLVSVDYAGSLGRFLPNGNGHGIYSNQVGSQYLALGALLAAKASTANIAAANAILQTAGLGAVGLPFANFNQNATIGQMLRPFPMYSISDNFPQDGKSAYNAFEFQLKQQSWKGLSFTVNYTYSRLIDDLATRTSTYVKTNKWNVDNGPQALKIYGSWVTPAYAAGNRLERSLTGGWIVSSIYTYYSGLPLVVTTSCAPQFSYFGSCRPTLNPAFSGSSFRSKVPYGSANFTQSAFTGTPFITSSTAFGNAPYNNPYGVTGPSTYTWDGSVRRQIPMFERLKLTLGADFFNITNHVEATGISTTITSSAFGTASKQSNSSRDIQLNAKFEF